MKVVINVGRCNPIFSVEQPKALTQIGSMPILLHIMKYYASYGYKDFILVCNEKAPKVKEFFINYSNAYRDFTISLKTGAINYLTASDLEDWNVTIIDAGMQANTGGALKAAQKYIGNEPFMYTYGDGLSNIDLEKLLSHHVRHKKMVTISAISATQKFGALEFNDNGSVIGFTERDGKHDSTLNGGYMVMNPEIFDLIDDDPETVLEREPLVTAVALGQVTAYRHHDYWQSLHSLSDLKDMNHEWKRGRALWKRWF